MKQLTELSPLERMIQQQVIERGIRDPRVLDACVPSRARSFFPRSRAREAYADTTAPIGHGQTISTPHIVALMSERLNVRPEHKVLEIGTGSGYQTAVLANWPGRSIPSSASSRCWMRRSSA